MIRISLGMAALLVALTLETGDVREVGSSRDAAQSEMPMWLYAPERLVEIRAIQRGDVADSDEGWGSGAGGSK